jgi:hypothetical protein
MALPVNFSGLTGGNQPLTLFDTQFAAVASLGSVPCAAAGQNAIALTPFANTPTIASYPDLAPSFVFVAAQTSNAAVTLNVNLVGARNCYKWNGGQAMGNGDLVAGQVYRAIPLQALNGGAGGFVVDTVGVASSFGAFEFVIDGGGSAITTGNKGQLYIPFACTINAWQVIADQVGSIAVDILRLNLGFPVASIVGAGNKPTLTAQQVVAVAPSGWTSTALLLDDFIAFNVTSAATVTRVTVSLRVNRI